ncbi:hypothetical protein [Sorangium sp. So ce204]|uniref:hypothetical protein n=1 Tax=Sorangium sp. So ce204 TaxID=3133288 RepID=UPI003F60E843
MSKDTAVSLWRPLDVVKVPKDVRAIEQLAPYAKQLAPREVKQIIKAFEDGSFEMGSVFAWQKTMSGLKRKLGALGMDFIGEMLDRKDVTVGSNPQQILTDYDALRLAEELGFFPSSHTLRLRHAMEVIAHFANPPDDADDDGMTFEEATGALRTCIQTVLGHGETEAALEFASFRKKLETQDFQSGDPEVDTLASSPYFFQRTTLRVLLSVIKTAQGAQLEHVLANLNTFLPAIWDGLLHPDRQSVGSCYAEVHAEGKQTAAAGVRASLLKVKGFDYVPELLRSRTFIEAAQRVLDAHEGWDNFRSEYAPMVALASLGTSIPLHALPRCMTAILSVALGNHWGTSWTASPIAKQMLSRLPPDRWVYYLNECLPADDVVLGKLTDKGIAERFVSLVADCSLAELVPRIQRVAKLVESAASGSSPGVVAAATNIFNKLRAA